MIAKLETFEDDIRWRKVLAAHIHYKASEADHRYIGWLANVTFNKASRENVSKKNTSSVALEYFKQVKF